MAEGDLTRSITVDASGEVAELKDNINSMVGSLRETTRANHEQDWLKTNLARISGLMQGHRDLTVVAETIMDELTPLVAAQYGAFYLAEDGDQGVELRLVGSYGRPAGSTRDTRFKLGESLVGQAARSRRVIAADDVPAGYVTLSSVLGHTARGSLIVLPILVEDQVLGVICWPQRLAPQPPQIQRQVEALAELCAHTLEAHTAAVIGPLGVPNALKSVTSQATASRQRPA